MEEEADFLVALASKGGGGALSVTNGSCNQCSNAGAAFAAMTDNGGGNWSSAPFSMCGDTCTWNIAGGPPWTLTLTGLTNGVIASFSTPGPWDGSTGSVSFAYQSDNGMCGWGATAMMTATATSV